MEFSSIDIICGLHVMIKNIQDNQSKLVDKMDTILAEFEKIKLCYSAKDNIILQIQETVSNTITDLQDIRSLLQDGYQQINKESEDEEEEEEEDEDEDEEEEEEEEDKLEKMDVEEVSDEYKKYVYNV